MTVSEDSISIVGMAGVIAGVVEGIEDILIDTVISFDVVGGDVVLLTFRLCRVLEDGNEI
jgi:hypothetical protein